MAAITNQPIICRFLAQQNTRLCLDEQLCRPDHGSRYKWLHLEPFEIYRRVLEIDDIVQQTQTSRASRFRLLASRLEDIQSLIALYHRCNEPALDPTEKEDFVNAAWDAAVYLFAPHHTNGDLSIPDDRLMGIWTEFFVDLIKQGVDVHRLISRSFHLSEVKKESCHTALSWILVACVCHRDLETVLSRWLNILEASQLDMHGYICHEIAFFQQPRRHIWRTTRNGWQQALSTKRIEGFEVPFWRRFVDPLGKAYDVRHEFRNWGCLYPIEGSLWFGQVQKNLAKLAKLAMKDHRQHIAMKERELLLAIQNDWPFEVSFVHTFDLNSLPSFGLSVKERSNIERSCLYARELVQSRFDRRQMRKLYKSGYLKREKQTLRVPGAWPISEW
ncbi:hypothetical protein LZ30DRAFT_249048 [Colletotrichum cereale]|nr:hypothetical protein LZ30DRAFT_249048 [Colletotrichum cereale]